MQKLHLCKCLCMGWSAMIGAEEYNKKQIVFVFANEGETLSFKNDNIVVQDKDGAIKHQSTCWRISVLFVVGSATLTSGLIERSHKFCFPIFLMKQSLRTYDVIGFKAEGNTLLKRLQYSTDGLEIAKHLIENKILNQRKTLMKQRFRGDAINSVISSLKVSAQKVCETSSIQELMGIEGSASRIYFKEHYNNCEWRGRQPRVKRDYINTTLDLGYTMLFNLIESLLYYFGFDLYVGNLHQEFYMRKSLVCDLVEPFRVLIDQCVRTAISNRQCKSEDFNNNNGRWLLEWKKNKEYVLFLLKPLLKYKNEMFKYVRDYYRAFVQQKPIEQFPVFEL